MYFGVMFCGFDEWFGGAWIYLGRVSNKSIKTDNQNVREYPPERQRHVDISLHSQLCALHWHFREPL